MGPLHLPPILHTDKAIELDHSQTCDNKKRYQYARHIAQFWLTEFQNPRNRLFLTKTTP